jgi:hypothetical protein
MRAVADSGSYNLRQMGLEGSDILFKTQTTSNISGVERMRIDSSGNLLVGTTDTNPASSNVAGGIALRESGQVNVSRDNNPPLQLNRKTADGDIAVFQKDGTTVGSVGTKNGALHIGSTTGSDSYFGFYSNQIIPTTSTGSDKDAVTDLGYSDSRFKDLYLSGGVYLGGTGSANKLEDYEEGTWTPTVKFGSGSSGITYSVREGKYTKIGDTVQYYIQCSLSSKGSSTGSLSITGFPFTNTDTASPPSVLTGSFTSTNDIQLYLSSGSPLLSFENRNTGTQTPLTNSNVNNNSTMFIAGVYRTSQ